MKKLTLSIIMLSMTYNLFASERYYFGSVDVGVGTQNSKDSNEKNNQNGSYLGAKGFVSSKFNNLTLDTGLGYLNYKIKTDLVAGQYSAVKLETKEPFLHISPKFEIVQNIMVGGELNYVFNKGVMLSPNNNSEFMTGLNLTYKHQVEKNVQLRFVGTISRTMDLSDKDLTLATLSLQLGFSNDKVEPIKLNNNQKMVSPGVINTKREITVVSLDDTFIHFDTNSYQLSLKSKALITELAAFLASHENMWEGLQIEGHTDFRGDDEYNTILSVKRANSVYEVMSSVAMPKDKVIFLGKGKNVPLTDKHDDDSLAQNRRVVLKFMNVSEKELLLNFLEELKRKYKNK